MKKHSYYYREKLKLCTKYYIKLKNVQILKKNYKFNNTFKQKLIIKKYNINKNYNYNKLKKFCVLTGRLRFIVKTQKMSRMTFREMVTYGFLSGYFKK